MKPVWIVTKDYYCPECGCSTDEEPPVAAFSTLQKAMDFANEQIDEPQPKWEPLWNHKDCFVYEHPESVYRMLITCLNVDEPKEAQ